MTNETQDRKPQTDEKSPSVNESGAGKAPGPTQRDLDILRRFENYERQRSAGVATIDIR